MNAQPVVLATTHHDPDGRLYDQAMRMLPALGSIFQRIAVLITTTTEPRSFELLAGAGALVASAKPDGYHQLGHSRRAALALGLQTGQPWILLCDLDRILHWVEYFPEELADVVDRLPDHDFSVLGRTTAAFDSHPRIQRDTEAIVNHVYGLASGRGWDITAAARGIGRRAAEAILAGCLDETIGTDASWPLFLQRQGTFTLGYCTTQGLEFETPDRFPLEVAAAGSREAWTAQLDTDPRHWALRLAIAQAEVAAMLG